MTDEDIQIQRCVAILRRIRNREVSASMSGIEYYFEHVEAAQKIIDAENREQAQKSPHEAG